MIELFLNLYESISIFLDGGLNGPKVSMDNQDLVKHLREDFLLKPVLESKGKRKDYSLSNMSLKDPSMGQANEISKIIDIKVSN